LDQNPEVGMKKILLIQPKSPETFWKLTGWLNITKEKALVPPLALVTVAALTPPEYEIKIVDEEVFGDLWDNWGGFRRPPDALEVPADLLPCCRID
jgi:hypothetical protein